MCLGRLCFYAVRLRLCVDRLSHILFTFLYFLNFSQRTINMNNFSSKNMYIYVFEINIMEVYMHYILYEHEIHFDESIIHSSDYLHSPNLGHFHHHRRFPCASFQTIALYLQPQATISLLSVPGD